MLKPNIFFLALLFLMSVSVSMYSNVLRLASKPENSAISLTDDEEEEEDDDDDDDDDDQEEGEW